MNYPIWKIAGECWKEVPESICHEEENGVGTFKTDQEIYRSRKCTCRCEKKDGVLIKN